MLSALLVPAPLNPASSRRRRLSLCANTIAERESEAGAFVRLDLEGARKAALAPASRTSRCAPPVALKDIFDTADMPTEYSSAIYAGYRPKYDTSLVALIRRNGGSDRQDRHHRVRPSRPGQDPQPANRAHTGRFVVGLGGGRRRGFCDHTGSGPRLSDPARGFCVAGFKPSYRLLPTGGMKCVSWHLDTAGLFALVADVAFAASAIGDRDLRVDRAPSSPRIAVLRDQPWPAAATT
jgi:Asp-tRNA(Asn)/Glu-tRNA(Gln) amidotransferase A subunit family amidase